MNFGKGLVIWRSDRMLGGNPQSAIQKVVELRCNAIWLKIGNGTKKWVGLEDVIAAARERDISVFGWWYIYGQALEGRIAAEHALDLGVEALALDVESHAKRSEAATPGLLEQIFIDTKNGLDGVPLGLCSYWKPSYHRELPFAEMLRCCDFNAPQMYWMGRTTEDGAEDVVKTCLQEYDQLFGWNYKNTVAIMAAFGQSINYGQDVIYWEANRHQVDAAAEVARKNHVAGVAWWSLDFMAGGAGSRRGTSNTTLQTAVSRVEWDNAPLPELTPEQKLAILWRQAKVRGWDLKP